ncbi:MAG: IS4 family transposase [Methanobrevibacter sp.]|jgi:hypothetical protein|nr:IS4 family transposase [Candidatus Methanovirga australis]
MFYYTLENLEKLISYEKESFVLVENKFSRNRLMPFGDMTHSIVGNTGKSTVNELDGFFEIKYGDDRMPISKQGYFNQRLYLDPEIFKETMRRSLTGIYSERKEDLSNFKGFNVLAVDGSEVMLPNTEKTRKDFEVELRALKKTDSPKARVSMISDVKNEFIIDSVIAPYSTGEQPLAYLNIEEASNIIDLTKSIVIFDRLYASTELIVQLLSKNSLFIFRLKKSIYKKERKRMKTDDEYVDINLNAGRTSSIKNEEIKEKAKELGSLNLRIVNIELETGGIETLLTNLPPEIASSEELKELYGERWGIERGYDVLKNKIEIENFSGKSKLIIEQDFYAQCLMYNLLISLKIELNKKIKKIKKFKDCEYKYKINMSILTGKLKFKLFYFIFARDEDERAKIMKGIEKTAERYLIKEKKKVKNYRNGKKSKKKYTYNNKRNF